MRISIDFDGTIVEHRYPEIGKERPFAIKTIKQLAADGHQLILNTVREGELLDAAVEWCEKRGVVFYAVNQNTPDETYESPGYTRKILADYYIDDRNIGGLPDWGTIYEIISTGKTFEDFLRQEAGLHAKKKPWWRF